MWSYSVTKQEGGHISTYMCQFIYQALIGRHYRRLISQWNIPWVLLRLLLLEYVHCEPMRTASDARDNGSHCFPFPSEFLLPPWLVLELYNRGTMFIRSGQSGCAKVATSSSLLLYIPGWLAFGRFARNYIKPRHGSKDYDSIPRRYQRRKEDEREMTYPKLAN